MDAALLVVLWQLAHVHPVHVLDGPQLDLVGAHFPSPDVKGPSLRLLEHLGGDLCPQAAGAVQGPDVQVGANAIERLLQQLHDVGRILLPEIRSPCSFLRNSSTSSVRLMTFLKEKGGSLLGQGSFSFSGLMSV